MELLSKFIPNTLALNVMRSWVKLKVREEDGKNRGSIVDAIHELADGDDEDAAAWCMRAIMAACVTAGWASSTKLDPRISQSGRSADAREGDGVYEKVKHYSLADKRVVGFWMPKFVKIEE